MIDVTQHFETGVSHFPPIDDYAFLSDCETTALVAPDGGVEWLCLPRMDSPSVFGAMLDRDAGRFRIAPAGVYVPAARRYIPGTLVAETSWWTPGGWLVVTDALLIGPWHHESERSHTQRRAPTDYEAAHVLLRLIRCVNGQIQVKWTARRCSITAGCRRSGPMSARGTTRPLRRRRRSRSAAAADHRPEHRFRGHGGHRTHVAEGGRHRFVALSWSEHAPPANAAGGTAPLRWTCHHWQHWLDRATFPDHPWRGHLQRSALTLKGLDLRPDRGRRRGRDHVAARNPWRRAQLGLPLHLDSRHRGNAVGVQHPGFRLGGKRLLQLRRRRRRCGGRRPAADVRRRRRARRSTRRPSTTCPATRALGPCGSATPPIASASMTCGVPWSGDRPAHRVTAARRPAVADRADPGRVRARALARARPGYLGGALRAAALHVLQGRCWMAADAGARIAAAAGEEALAARWRAAAEEIRADVLANAVDERGVFTQHYGTKALDASVLLIPLLGFLPAERRAGPQHRARDRRGADRGRHGAALPRRRYRGRPVRRGGHVHDLLVLAGVGAGRDR